MGIAYLFSSTDESRAAVAVLSVLACGRPCVLEVPLLLKLVVRPAGCCFCCPRAPPLPCVAATAAPLSLSETRLVRTVPASLRCSHMMIGLLDLRFTFFPTVGPPPPPLREAFGAAAEGCVCLLCIAFEASGAGIVALCCFDTLVWRLSE